MELMNQGSSGLSQMLELRTYWFGFLEGVLVLFL